MVDLILYIRIIKLKMLELSNYKDQMQYLSKQENNKVDYVIKTLSKQIKEAEDEDV